MKERKLTEDQKKRIAQIKAKWFEELRKIPEVTLEGAAFSNASNAPRRRLEEKYLPQIKAIYEEQ